MAATYKEKRYKEIGTIPIWLIDILTSESTVQRYNQLELWSIIKNKFDKKYVGKQRGVSRYGYCQNIECKHRFILSESTPIYYLYRLIPKDWLCKKCLRNCKLEEYSSRELKTFCKHCKKECFAPRSQRSRKKWKERGWCLCGACTANNDILKQYTIQKVSSDNISGDYSTVKETGHNLHQYEEKIIKNIKESTIACNGCSQIKHIEEYNIEAMFLYISNCLDCIFCSKCFLKLYGKNK